MYVLLYSCDSHNLLLVTYFEKKCLLCQNTNVKKKSQAIQNDEYGKDVIYSLNK